jgi:drug/metabolite transporter (DMT)-like permease
MNIIAWFIFVVAAMLEVGGDSIIRRGLRDHRIALVLAGCATLCGYGLLVNSVKWEFSKLLGIYASVFAFISVLCGWIVFGEKIPPSTWLGMGLIMAGGLIIQFGQR